MMVAIVGASRSVERHAVEPALGEGITSLPSANRGAMRHLDDWLTLVAGDSTSPADVQGG